MQETQHHNFGPHTVEVQYIPTEFVPIVEERNIAEMQLDESLGEIATLKSVQNAQIDELTGLPPDEQPITTINYVRPELNIPDPANNEFLPPRPEDIQPAPISIESANEIEPEVYSIARTFLEVGDVAVSTGTPIIEGLKETGVVSGTMPGYKEIGRNGKLRESTITKNTIAIASASKPGNTITEQLRTNAYLKEFTKQGVSELVTISDGPAGSFSKLVAGEKAQSGSDEAATVITYENLSQHSEGRFPMIDNFGRGSVQTVMHLVIPASQKEEFIKALREFPELPRAILDLVFSEQFDTALDEAWSGALGFRPDYNLWRQNNNGKSKIALRTNFKQGPEDAEIIEF